MQTKQGYAYQVLKERILQGELLPGERIVANRFAQEIGTSAIPVREALLRLEAERLVDITPHIGAVVTLITGRMVERTLETLAVMEGYATRLAAPCNQGVLDELARLNTAMVEAIGDEDWERFSSSNRAFHATIYAAADNEVLTDTIADLWNQLDSYLSAAAFYLMPDRAPGSVEEHAEIIALLSAPDADLTSLEILAREHKLDTSRRLQPLISRDRTDVASSA
jgi:DNA-binding GntR family transcriptional regulator